MSIPVDPVKNSKLVVLFNDGYTIHLIPDEKRIEGVRIQKWRRDGDSVQGGFGRVWREVLEDRETSKTGLPANKKFRAVKEIAKTVVSDQVFRRELKAIVNFSQAKV